MIRVAVVRLEIVLLEFAEIAAERDLLRGIQILAGKHQHQMPVPGGQNFPSREIVERLSQVDACDLRADCESEWCYDDACHADFSQKIINVLLHHPTASPDTGHLQHAIKPWRCVRAARRTLLQKPRRNRVVIAISLLKVYIQSCLSAETIMRYTTQVKPISYLKANAAEVLAHLNEVREPMVITQNGEAKAVLQDVASYQETQETLALLKLLALGNRDVEAGRVKPVAGVVRQLRKRITGA